MEEVVRRESHQVHQTKPQQNIDLRKCSTRFHVVEEVTRSPFGVQTRQNLDSSQRRLMPWSGRWGNLDLLVVSDEMPSTGGRLPAAFITKPPPGGSPLSGGEYLLAATIEN